MTSVKISIKIYIKILTKYQNITFDAKIQKEEKVINFKLSVMCFQTKIDLRELLF